MSWFTDNKFNATLGGGTLVGAILLLVVGFKGSGAYNDAKDKFSAAADEAGGYERLPLYPKIENENEKRKALGEYRKATDSLQAAFEPFRPKEIKDITPQEFTSRLLAANTEVRKAFEEAGTVVPEPFFMGFERYKTSLAPGNTTGVLDYQLSSVKNLMLALARAKATELKNVYRPSLAEEEGQTYTPAANVVARPFPLEITFTGTEKSVREFLSSIAKTDSQYLVIRSLRITNMKKDPPRAADAQFDKPAGGDKATDGGASEVFSGGFVLPGEETPATPAAPADKPAVETPAAKVADSSRILSQILGSEQLQVFLRLDLLQFLPAKKLP